MSFRDGGVFFGWKSATFGPGMYKNMTLDIQTPEIFWPQVNQVSPYACGQVWRKS